MYAVRKQLTSPPLRSPVYNIIYLIAAAASARERPALERISLPAPFVSGVAHAAAGQGRDWAQGLRACSEIARPGRATRRFPSVISRSCYFSQREREADEKTEVIGHFP